MYIPGSNNLKNVGFLATNTSDFGFADIKAAISTLAAGGVESFLSMCVCNERTRPFRAYRLARKSVQAAPGDPG